MKCCTKCKNSLPPDMFYRNSQYPDGLHPHCKSCKAEKDRARYQRKKEEICKAQRARHKKNAESYRANARQRYKKRMSDPKEREHILRRKNEWSKQRSKKDPSYRINRSMSREVSRQIRKGGKGWKDIVGYTLGDLMSHLERQFDSKMSWENYGSYWHIDHIVPKSSFKIKSAGDKEFMECWSLSNLRPLPAILNLKKYNKMESII